MSGHVFTARECRQIVHALRLAKRRITIGVSRFICIALDDLVNSGDIQEATCCLVQGRIIMRRLRPYASLDSWIIAKVATERGGDDAFEKAVRQHRIKWLDLMIKEFSDLAKVAQ